MGRPATGRESRNVSRNCVRFRLNTMPSCPTSSFAQSLKDSYQYGEKIQFRCRKDYVLDGPNATICGDNGKWGGRGNSKCSPFHCARLQAPPFGSVSDTNLTVLDCRVSFSCQDGYKLDGQEFITYISNGNWPAHFACPPVCVARSCSDPPTIENGWMAVRGNRVGDTVSYTCQPGYRLSGPSPPF